MTHLKTFSTIMKNHLTNRKPTFKLELKHTLLIFSFLVTPIFVSAQSTQVTENILITSTKKSVDEVVASVKSYAGEKKWAYLGDYKLNKDKVTVVKTCSPQVGNMLWAIGSHLGAMLPCVNLSVYQNSKGITEISMLHPRYLQILYPHPEVEKAVLVATPLLADMLEKISN